MSRSGIRKLLGILAVLLLIALLAVFYQLGGFNPVRIELVQVDNYFIAGRHFDGSFRSDTIRVYFEEMRALVIQSKVQGQPVIIYDQEPDGTRGISKSFIGVVLTDNGAAPDDLEHREISASHAIRVSKDAHISVMPKPVKIAKKIKRFSEQNGVPLAGPSIEIYMPNNRLVIEQPVFLNE
jgi:hypothetical protein